MSLIVALGISGTTDPLFLIPALETSIVTIAQYPQHFLQSIPPMEFLPPMQWIRVATVRPVAFRCTMRRRIVQKGSRIWRANKGIPSIASGWGIHVVTAESATTTFRY